MYSHPSGPGILERIDGHVTQSDTHPLFAQAIGQQTRSGTELIVIATISAFNG
jgi:hypothetical protein